MKKIIFVVFICCYIYPQPPFLSLDSNSQSSVLREFDIESQQLLTDNLNPKRREKLIKKAKEHSVDIVIATLYLAGGLSFFSPVVRDKADLSASMLWVATSAASLALVIKKLYS